MNHLKEESLFWLVRVQSSPAIVFYLFYIHCYMPNYTDWTNLSCVVFKCLTKPARILAHLRVLYWCRVLKWTSYLVHLCLYLQNRFPSIQHWFSARDRPMLNIRYRRRLRKWKKWISSSLVFFKQRGMYLFSTALIWIKFKNHLINGECRYGSRCLVKVCYRTLEIKLHLEDRGTAGRSGRKKCWRSLKRRLFEHYTRVLLNPSSSDRRRISRLQTHKDSAVHLKTDTPGRKEH